MSKKSFKNLVKGWLASACIFSVCIFANSCNVGLGENVDTEAPVVDIVYPPLASIIRDDFILFGKWSDDKGVNSVTVNVINTLTKETEKSFPAEINNDNTWQVLISSSDFKDGTYQLSVFGTDEAGHKSGTSSRSFDFDNTAPVFIISNPGVVKSSGDAASAYGSSFSVEGTIADDHAISFMDLKVYKCNEDGSVGELISNGESSYFEELDIATAGGTEVHFANSANGESDNYYKIYSTAKQEAGEKTQKFYCSIEVSDAAGIFIEPSDALSLSAEASKGNATSSVYLYDSVYQSLMSTKNGGLGLTANDIKNIINGTVENADVLAKLNNYEKNTADESTDNYLFFSLNPDANPTYTVNGYDVDLTDADAVVKQCSGGSSVSVTFKYGLDETNIQPWGQEATTDVAGLPSLKVWLKPFSSLPSKKDALDELAGLEASVKLLENDENQVFTEAETKSGDWLLIYDYSQQNEKSSSVANETISVNLPSGKIESDTYYLVGVTGCDMDKIYFAQSVPFLFQGTTTGFAPTVEIKTPANNGNYYGDSALTFDGTAVMDGSETLYVKYIEATLTYGISGQTSKDYKEKLQIVKDGTNFTVRKYAEGSDTGVALTGNEALSFDPETGAFSFNAGKISGYSALVSEMNGGKLYKYNLSVSATSSSTHTSTVTRNCYIDVKKPDFKDENSSVGGKKTMETVRTTWFSSEALTVYGEFTDAGSGVESVNYWLDTEPDAKHTNSTGTAVPAVSADDNTLYTFRATISGFSETSDEPHELILIATDKSGNESSQVRYSVKVDNTAPKFNARYYTMGSDISGETGGNLLTNKKLGVTLYGTVSDSGSGLASVTIPGATVTYTTKDASTLESSFDAFKTWISDASFSAYSAANASAITGWKAVIPAENITEGDVNAVSLDVAGNKSTVLMFTFNVDQKLPEVEYKEIADADTDTAGTQVNGKITVSGTANDNNQMNMITKLQYKVGAGAWTDYTDGISSSSTAYSWSSNSIDTSKAPFASSKTSPLTVSFRAVALDKAGNESDSEDAGITVEIDQNSDRPVIKFSSLDSADAIISTQNILGSISDDDGVKTFEYSADNGLSWNEIEVTSGSWKIEGLEAGTHSLSFRVTDKAGTVFTTGNTAAGTFASYDRPYIVYGTAGEKQDNTAAVSFQIDLSAPVIQNMKIAAMKSESAAPSTLDWGTSNVSFGKEAKYMWVYAEVVEDVAMHSDALSDVSVSIDGNEMLLTDEKITKTGTTGTDGKLTYKIGAIDVSSAGEGTLTATLTVTDKSGRASSSNLNIFLDGDAPEVSVTTPNATESGVYLVTSDEITGKSVIKGKTTDASKIKAFKYLIPTNAQITADVTKSSDGWIDMKDVTDEEGNKLNYYDNKSSCNWQIPFYSSKFDEDDGTSIIYYATVKSAGKLVYAEKTEGGVFVPLYFYVEDVTGNSNIVKSKIFVNPEGGIPVLEIVTPDDFAKTGGNLNIQGTASDDEKVAKVVLEKLEFSATDATKDTIDDVTDWKTVTKEILSETDVVVKGTVQDDGSVLALGTLKSDGSVNYASWKFAINTSKINTAGTGKLADLIGTTVDADGSSVAKDIKIARATITAYDENGTANTFSVSTLENDGEKVVRNIFTDKNAPKLSNIQFVQFDGAASVDAVPVISRAYSAGMYISNNTGNGEWYLKGTITDDASVTGVTVSTTGKSYLKLDGFADTSSSSGITADGMGTKVCTFIMPVDTSKTGQFYPTIELDDGQHTDVTQNLSFYVDNTAPALYTTTYNSTKKEYVSSTELNHSSELKLTDNTGSIVSEENVIENSDGSYTFGDTLTEEGSGLAYVVYYFKKVANDKNATNRVYSPMFNTNRTNDNEVELADVKTANKVYINSENLPALVKTVTRPAAQKISYTGLGTNKNIRNGGLVKIGGSYHLISAIEGDTVTLEDEVDETFTEAEFIYAQVVNHLVTEGFDSSAENGVSNDDGDGMVEMVKQTGATYRWTSSIYSDNVKDGPAQIHVVAFDEAGNMNSGYVSTSIQNNRPRISKVYLGTDLNGNNKFEYFSEDENGAVNSIDERDGTGNGTEFGELSFYSALSADGKIQGSVTLKSSSFTVKNKLLVLPEIIGGNGNIGCLYTAADTAEEAGVVKGPVKAVSSTAAGLSLADKTGTEQTVASLLALHGKADGFNFLSTTTAEYDEEKHGEAKNGSYKGIVIDNDYLKTQESWTAAGGRQIKYFAFTFWDSTEETTQGTDSLYALLKVPMAVNVIDDVAPEAVIKPFWWNSKDDSSFVYDEDGNPEGHIDIDDGTGRENPGVSGTVWINGTADDETLLKELWFTSPDGEKHQIASYTGGVWTVENDGWPENWLDVEFLDTPEPTQSGHTVDFRMKINMTPYGIDTGKTVDVSAKDKAGTASKASTAQTIDPKAKAGGKLTSHYIMDFVPYIKSIYPATEEADLTAAGSANRSRLGKFPVQAGQPMIIEGMNFATGSEYAVKFYKTNASADTDGTVQGTLMSTVADANVEKVEDGKIKVTAPDYSRYVEVVVDNVATKNNTNTNGGYNIEEGYVAKDTDKGFAAANRAGTNFWTDDRYISVWNVETNLSGSINPHSGVIKKVTAANSANGKLGTTAGSLNTKEGGDGVEPVTGLTDTYFAALSSDDLRIYTYDLGSKTGNDIANRYTFGTNQTDIFRVPADAVDCTLVNGVPYYVVQDNWVGNVDANCWGPGLFMARAGWQWNKTDLNSDGNPANTGNYNVIIEKQGNSGSARARNSKEGYDYVLYQFKNPRIAGWHKEAAELTYDANSSEYAPATDYIYISYYDSYARCLKFAAYRAGYRTHNGGKLKSVGGMWGSNTGRSGGAGGDLEVEVRMADDMTGGKAVVAGFDTLNDNPTQFVEEVGEWSDIMVDVTTENDPHPVIVYYNMTKRSLEVAYGKTAFPKMETGNVVSRDSAYDSATDNTETVWTKTKGITPDSKVDFGRYVSAAMDKDGNLHIAAQDATNVKLYYMFLKKNGETYTVDESKTTVVDGTRGTGSWTDIELTDASGNSPETCNPVISYINSSYLKTTNGAKVAYAVEFDANGKPTFEAMTDPAKWQVGDQRTSVLPSVKEDKSSTSKATVAVGFNSNMLALDFLRGEQ